MWLYFRLYVLVGGVPVFDVVRGLLVRCIPDTQSPHTHTHTHTHTHVVRGVAGLSTVRCCFSDRSFESFDGTEQVDRVRQMILRVLATVTKAH